MPEQIVGDIFSAKLFRKLVALINDPTISHMASGKIRVWDVIEISVRVGIVQRTVLAKTLPIIPPLNTVQISIRAEVRRIDQVSILIKIQSPGIPATFTKQLKLFRDRMIPPNA